MASFDMPLTKGGNTLKRTAGVIGFSDANADRIIAAQRGRRGMPVDATAAQVWDRVIEDTFDRLKTETIDYERQQARATADSGVADIPMS